ncbi:hypothetical protein [Hufsiella ginkgonis]|uniref:Uncharacterized protein n=1 Tax=Hufsiella ginkgonis TaxID=2695274 RepID=A0A7K1Y0Q9_9SPHI|nr:hypothetical protein [Hufsiella ginkgonis]MXV16830.1 hypothetical protein [Hufsiella ginkgonis]
MERLDVLNNLGAAITQEKTEIEVGLTSPEFFESVLIKLKLKKPVKKFYLKPLCLGPMIRIARILLAVDLKEVDVKNLLSTGYQLLDKHGEDVARVIVLAIKNNKKKVSRADIDFVLQNYEAKEILSAFRVIVDKMDVSAFTASIALIKGNIKILEDEASPAST